MASSTPPPPTARAPEISLSVKTLRPATHTVRISPDATLADLKRLLVPITGTPLDQQRLIFRGRVLVDGASLASQGISEDGTALHLVPREPGPPGAASGFSPTVTLAPGGGGFTVSARFDGDLPSDVSAASLLRLLAAGQGGGGGGGGGSGAPAANDAAGRVIRVPPPPHLYAAVGDALTALTGGAASTAPRWHGPPPLVAPDMRVQPDPSPAAALSALRSLLAGSAAPPTPDAVEHAAREASAGRGRGQSGAPLAALAGAELTRRALGMLQSTAPGSLAATLGAGLSALSPPSLATDLPRAAPATDTADAVTEAIAAAVEVATLAGAAFTDLGRALSTVLLARLGDSALIMAPTSAALPIVSPGRTWPYPPPPGALGLAALIAAAARGPGGGAPALGGWGGAGGPAVSMGIASVPMSAGMAGEMGMRMGMGWSGGGSGGRHASPPPPRATTGGTGTTPPPSRSPPSNAARRPPPTARDETPRHSLDVVMTDGQVARVDLAPVLAAAEAALGAHPGLTALARRARLPEAGASGGPTSAPHPSPWRLALEQLLLQSFAATISTAAARAESGGGSAALPPLDVTPDLAALAEEAAFAAQAAADAAESAAMAAGIASAGMTGRMTLAGRGGGGRAPAAAAPAAARAPAAPAPTPAPAPPAPVPPRPTAGGGGPSLPARPAARAKAAAPAAGGRSVGGGGSTAAPAPAPAAVEEIRRRPAARATPPASAGASPDLGALLGSLLGGGGGAPPGSGGGGGFMDVLGAMASSPAMQQMAEQMMGGGGGGGGGGGNGPPPDIGALLSSVMPMVGQMMGGGGGGGGAPGGGGSRSSSSRRTVQRGDLSALDAELPAGDAARWKAAIESDRKNMETAPPLSEAYLASGGVEREERE